MPPSPGQRALDATLADWRHERALATTRRRRLMMHVRSMIAVVRTVWRAGFAETPVALKCSLLPRVLMFAAAWFAFVWWNSGVPGDDRFLLVASAGKASTLVVASFMGPLVVMFPVLVFLAEATGRRSRVTPAFGSIVLLLGCVLVLTLVVWPSATAFVRYEAWRYFANASQPEPAIPLLIQTALSVSAALFAAVATVTMFVLARGVRRVGGVTGWVVGVGPVLGVWLSAIGFVLLSVPLHVPPAFRIGVMLMQPLALFAAALWSTRWLTTIEARMTASSSHQALT